MGDTYRLDRASASPILEVTTARGRRPDIQGLRALAVLMVVAFHAGAWVPGGFVGVDVFFVISGFVITSLLRREWSETGRIRFGAFYLRRFKRLTPALAVMVTATTLFSVLVLSPRGPQQVAAGTARGAMLLFANLVIQNTTGGYFDPPAERNPLLNTWSLSVEEQFYLVFPLVLAAGWAWLPRFGGRWSNPSGSARVGHWAACLMVGAVAVVSVGRVWWLASAAQESTTATDFYDTVGRAWEFAVGAGLALAVDRLTTLSRGLATAVGAAGLVGLGLSLWLISGETPFPGSWTALPVASAAALLVAGVAHPHGVVSRSLSMRPMVAIGDWSYSIYLWHWPFVVFARVLWPGQAWVLPVACVVSVIPALASYVWVEQPLRLADSIGRARLATLVAVTVATPLAVASVAPSSASRWAPVVPFEGHDEFYASLDSRWFRCSPDLKRLVIERDPAGKTRCFRSQPHDRFDVVLFGDSHAEHLFPGLAAARPDVNVLVLMDGSEPFTGNPRVEPMLDYIQHHDTIRAVVYAAFWDRRIPSRDSDVSPILAPTLARLHAPGRSIVLVEDVPSFTIDVTDCVGNTILRVRRCREVSSSRRLVYMPSFRAQAQADSRLQVAALRDLFCVDETCRMEPQGALLFRDPNHLNVAGSAFVAPRVVAALERTAAVGSLGDTSAVR